MERIRYRKSGNPRLLISTKVYSVGSKRMRIILDTELIDGYIENFQTVDGEYTLVKLAEFKSTTMDKLKQLARDELFKILSA